MIQKKLQNLDQLEAIYEKSYETIIGNCDTHVFLGSNSYKTVEYFSKALGEKTIERDSISINRDRQNWKTGKSVSDQVMARALMTPDELRRMDNDLCIVFEKGIKPVKANKFYYFKHPMAKEMKKYEISHNDIGEIERGEWRKYNPYNPYVPESEKTEQANNLQVESLDDLFEDDNKKEETKNEAKKEDKKINRGRKVEKKETKVNLEELDEEDFILPQEPIHEEEDVYDLQKELEAKFDELFGPLDEEN